MFSIQSITRLNIASIHYSNSERVLSTFQYFPLYLNHTSFKDNIVFLMLQRTSTSLIKVSKRLKMLLKSIPQKFL